uniref:Uncharacterized protein n=1 Tax=Human betaherpesvirus 6 TaxID=10368 RepID=A0A5P9S4K1_9BETA|nr:hypothetical protein [Human betaherpesvirus 6]QFV21899.1 hypothetical protein [Human betaherpesvirus 6]
MTLNTRAAAIQSTGRAGAQKKKYTEVHATDSHADRRQRPTPSMATRKKNKQRCKILTKETSLHPSLPHVPQYPPP